MVAHNHTPMKSKASASSRSSSPVKKTLGALTKSRTAGIVAAVVGTAVTTAVGAALVKRARGATGKKKSAAKKTTATRSGKAPRRTGRGGSKGSARARAKASS